ncbi:MULTISPECIES: hypothetical protein [Streptomyces]|uniref:Uncharacterized protein n=1 Tax=Streptomyces canarius TaxID=285453 RepID=A0ABQ3D4F3_9ACTN|nr:hypothetical protein [Streptomyces canarius]GHA52483.1 hypothetical protein GCM10010345_66480 [Streptomyces canarius]
MVHIGQPAGRDAGLPSAAHQRHGDLNLLAPNEVLVGNRAAVADALTDWRVDPSLLTASSEHAAHTFSSLAERLNVWEDADLDTAPVRSGLRRARIRYAEFGLDQLLPLNRVLVGAESARPGAWGGFHHPNQGYRHMQMAALITMYGPMGRAIPADPGLAMLDVVRAYAHDSLHYGSARRYVLTDGRVTRTQYGINWRRPDGRSYSAADPHDAHHTRNLGVVMEGACDREARRITRYIASRFGITSPDSPDDPGWWAYRDVTGQLGAAEDPGDLDTRISGEAGAYVASLCRYENGVNRRYERWLAEFGAGEPEDLHDLVVAAIINGDTARLCRWLDDRHGPGAFSGMFQAGGYLAAPSQKI